MNPMTLETAEFDSKEAADAAGFTVPLTKQEFGQVNAMNRKQRRQFLKDKRKSGYMPSPYAKGKK
jgi:hypothetical protein